MALSAGELTAIVIGVGNFTAWAKLFVDARKNGNGKDKSCPWHTGVEGRLSTIETRKDDLTTSLSSLHKENREDHQKIFEDIKGLSIAVAGAASAAAQAAVAASRGTKARDRTKD